MEAVAVEGGGADESGGGGKLLTKAQRRERERNIQLHVRLVEHASRCDVSSNCPSQNCAKMKTYLKHIDTCKVKASGGCNICKRVWTVLGFHVKDCKLRQCLVSKCNVIRERIMALRRQQGITSSCRPVEGTTAGKPNTSNGASRPAKGSHDVATRRRRQGRSRLRRLQKRLLLLRHARICPCEDGKCPANQVCAVAKILWKHMPKCEDQHCKVPHCMSSRYVLSHYRRCKDRHCKTCKPVRDVIRQSEAEAEAEAERSNNKRAIIGAPFDILDEVDQARKRAKTTMDLTSEDSKMDDAIEPDGSGAALREQVEQQQQLLANNEKEKALAEAAATAANLAKEAAEAKVLAAIHAKKSAEAKAVAATQAREDAEAKAVAATQAKEDIEATLEETKIDLEDANDNFGFQARATDIWQGRFDEIAALAREAGVDAKTIAAIRDRSMASGK